MVGPKLSHSLLNIAGVPAAMLEDGHPDLPGALPFHGIAQSRLYPGIRRPAGRYVAAGRPMAVATQKPEGLARMRAGHTTASPPLPHHQRGSAADEAAAAERLRSARPASSPQRMADLREPSTPSWWGTVRRTWPAPLANGLDCIGVGWGFAPDGELEAAGAVAVVHDTAACAPKSRSWTTVRAAALSEVRNDGAV